MKAQTPFWPLLKNELAFSRIGGTGQFAGIILGYWLCAGALPSLVMCVDGNSRGNIATLFEAGFLPIMAFMFLSFVTVWVTYATVPAFSELLSLNGSVPGTVQNLGAFEFLFTRALDRRILCRARTAAFFMFALTPLLLNVVASPFAPEISFAASDSTSAEAVQRHELYLRAFPASHPGTGPTVGLPGQIVLPHGAVAYTAWLAWSGTLAVLLLYGYGTWIAKWVKPNNWWTALFAVMPMFFLLAWLILVARGSLKTHISIYENSFLLFATHPLPMVIALAIFAVAIQAWCERRFSQLEIL